MELSVKLARGASRSHLTNTDPSLDIGNDYNRNVIQRRFLSKRTIEKSKIFVAARSFP